MDRQTANRLRTDMLAALQPIADAHALRIDAKGGSFDDTTCRFKVEFVDVQDGVALTSERRMFTCSAPLFGLKPEHLDATFQAAGTEYRITGLSPSRRKFPVLAVRTRDDREFKFGADTVVRALEGIK